MILMSVDLPAPFSPSKARTSPAATEKSTRSSERTPGKAFDMRLASTIIRQNGALPTKPGAPVAHPAIARLLRIVDREGLRIVVRSEAGRQYEIHRLVEANIVLSPHVGANRRRLVALRDDYVRIDEIELRHGGAGEHLERNFDRGPAHRRRIVEVEHRDLVLDRQSQAAVEIRASRRRDRTGFVAGRDEGLDRAAALDARVVPNAIDLVAILLDHRRDDGLRLGRVPVRVLHVQNLDAGILAKDRFGRSNADFRRTCPGLTRQHDNVALAVKLLDQPLREESPGHEVGRGNETDKII